MCHFWSVTPSSPTPYHKHLHTLTHTATQRMAEPERRTCCDGSEVAMREEPIVCFYLWEKRTHNRASANLSRSIKLRCCTWSASSTSGREYTTHPRGDFFFYSKSVYHIFSTHKGTKSNILKINLLLLRSFIPLKAKTLIHHFPRKNKKNPQKKPEIVDFSATESLSLFRKAGLAGRWQLCYQSATKWKNRRSRILSGQESGHRRRKCVIVPTSSPDSLLTNSLINLK